jgi:hypothetical protein
MARENGIPKLGDGYVHISSLKYIARSAAHYRVAVERRLKPTAPMRFGSLVHALLLGGCYYAVFDGSRNSNAYKAFEAKQDRDTLIIKPEELDRARLVAAAVRNDPIAAPWLIGEHERTILWEYQDRACSSRLDVLGDGHIVDVKTTTNAEPELLTRLCTKMGYHAQLAFYVRAAAAVGVTVRSARIIAVETTPPFAVTTLTLSPRTLLVGEKLCRIWMERLLSCEATGSWPSYIQCEVPWDLEDEAPRVTIDGEEVEAA